MKYLYATQAKTAATTMRRTNGHLLFVMVKRLLLGVAEAPLFERHALSHL
jgi:hypothetical protein